MGRIALLLLIACLLAPVAWAQRVCVINSYTIPAAEKVEGLLKKNLESAGFSVVDEDCSVKVVLGTPALIEHLKKRDYGKLVFSFVLFPEEFLKRYPSKRVYGVRIFPLPERTVRDFFKSKKLKRRVVAVPVSRQMVEIAKEYLPKKYFKLLVFNDSPTEVFPYLVRYKFVYIFPDPKLLKVVNLLRLVDFGKENRIVFLTGLGDLKRYGIDFVEEVSYEKLVDLLTQAVRDDPKERILPCPLKDER